MRPRSRTGTWGAPPITTPSIFATKDSSAFQIPTSCRRLWPKIESFDLDFGAILAIFRLRNQARAIVNSKPFHVINDCAAELSRGALVESPADPP
jgi:hypothetical protein